MIALLRTGLAVAYLLVVVPPCALIAFPLTFISGKIDFLYWLAMKIVRSGLRVVGVKTRVVGMEHFDPAGTYIFMSNHVSNIDPPLMLPLIPRRTSVMVKKELFSYPLLGKTMRLGSLVPVDRGNREAGIAAVRAAAEVIR